MNGQQVIGIDNNPGLSHKYTRRLFKHTATLRTDISTTLNIRMENPTPMMNLRVKEWVVVEALGSRSHRILAPQLENNWRAVTTNILRPNNPL